MNEEEKEAIKTIKSFKNMKWYNHAFDKGVEILTEEERREIDIIINLIDKQQEEIKARLEEIDSLYKMMSAKDNIINFKDDEIKYLEGKLEQYVDTPEFEENYISKDKIEEKIKELESHIWKDGYMGKFDRYAIHYLNELLLGE